MAVSGDTTTNGTDPRHATADELPHDLESTMLTQFDNLVDKGEIMWAPYISEPIEDRGFKAVFQVAPHLIHKPIESGVTKPKTEKRKDPFLNPDPNYIAAMVGPAHTLLLNKFCVYRPSLVLHTNEFAPQSADLDASDLSAAWSVLTRLESRPSTTTKTRYMMIYNCGVNSGSSQPHKHMQIWPYPEPNEIGFELFPSLARSTTEITDDIPDVPHRHFAIRLTRAGHEDNSRTATTKDVESAYARLLDRIHDCHAQHGSTAYNVAMTLDWLCLIPRRRCGISRGAGFNPSGALGLVWVLSHEEKQIWARPSLCE